jgi:hypothetical protein
VSLKFFFQKEMESNKSLLWEKDCLAQRNLEELITSKIITSKMRHAAVEKLGRSTNDARLKENCEQENLSSLS